jgi:hypothetical protein
VITMTMQRWVGVETIYAKRCASEAVHKYIPENRFRQAQWYPTSARGANANRHLHCRAIAAHV